VALADEEDEEVLEEEEDEDEDEDEKEDEDEDEDDDSSSEASERPTPLPANRRSDAETSPEGPFYREGAEMRRKQRQRYAQGSSLRQQGAGVQSGGGGGGGGGLGGDDPLGFEDCAESRLFFEGPHIAPALKHRRDFGTRTIGHLERTSAQLMVVPRMTALKAQQNRDRKVQAQIQAVQEQQAEGAGYHEDRKQVIQPSFGPHLALIIHSSFSPHSALTQPW